MWYLFLLETVVTVLCFAKNALSELYFLLFLPYYSANVLFNRLLRFFVDYSFNRLSIMMVTGPSLMSATCISAPNTPCLVGLPSSWATSSQ